MPFVVQAVCSLFMEYEFESERTIFLNLLMENNFVSLLIFYVFIVSIYLMKPLKSKGDKLTYWLYTAFFSLVMLFPWLVNIIADVAMK